ncbi:MAG: hypothetical protein M3335_04055 [Actinomycetota bacterium]|nr:hypothetical protein [Actinomycetota bacterium]
MKYIKMLGLAAVAAAALMAFVGASTASATVLCKVNTATTGCHVGGNAYAKGTTIKGNLTATAILETVGGEVLNKCTGSTLEGKTETTGGAAETVEGKILTLSWSGCEKHTTTLSTGKLVIHYSEKDNGTLTASGTEVTINGIFGTSCVYGAGEGLNLGTVVGGSPATIAINTIVPRISGGFLCPAEARWTASYELTSPKPLYIAEN